MSATRRVLVRLGTDSRGRRLDAVLAEWLPGALGQPLSKADLRRLVLAGTVTVNGHPQRQPDAVLPASAQLEAFVRLDLLRPRTTDAPLGPLRVLFEDQALIAVDKPPGVQMHATADPLRADFYSFVKAFLARRAGRDDVYLGLHQRLDRDTSGVVLFTLDPAANAGLAAAFERHEVVKTYVALTHVGSARTPAAWRASGQLGLVGQGREQHVGTVATGGQGAVTDFRLIEALRDAYYVEAVPRTGRKHQIRAQLAEAGWPILGDTRYAPGQRTPAAVTRALLHAHRLELRHPLTGAALRIESPLPGDFLDVLARLKGGIGDKLSHVGPPETHRPRAVRTGRTRR